MISRVRVPKVVRFDQAEIRVCLIIGIPWKIILPFVCLTNQIIIFIMLIIMKLKIARCGTKVKSLFSIKILISIVEIFKREAFGVNYKCFFSRSFFYYTSEKAV